MIFANFILKTVIEMIFALVYISKYNSEVDILKKFLSSILCLCIVFSLCSCSLFDNSIAKHNSEDFLVHFIDVGQGDCILLESEDDFVLIDAGESEYGATVCQYLLDNKVKSIDYVIATHPHSDHCGGLTEVIETFPCENFITVETDQQSKIWLNVLYAVNNENVNYIDAQVGDTYSFGNASFEIMGPYSKIYDNYNDYSVIVKATYKSNSFLFTGDAEKAVESEMLENGADLKADVLKVSHHGSATSSSIDFLDAVSPSYSVITCGMYNDYGHPHRETTDHLNHKGIITYRTDIMGTVVAVSNGNDIQFFYENEEDVPSPTRFDTSKLSYVGNKNTKKFHLSTCDGATSMSSKNKVNFKNREQAIDNGYSPCKTCNP